MLTSPFNPDSSPILPFDAALCSITPRTRQNCMDSGRRAIAPTPHAAPGDSSDTHRSEAEYDIPNVTLVREDGTQVKLRAELNDGGPVVLNFVYTSCTTIGPMSSQVFEQFQNELGTDQDSVHLVSISFDPQQDTPTRLRAYAAQ